MKLDKKEVTRRTLTNEKQQSGRKSQKDEEKMRFVTKNVLVMSRHVV